MSWLRQIAGFTVAVPDLDAATQAYSHCLGYQPGARQVVSSDQAGLWGVPAAAGLPSQNLVPATGAASTLRLIQSPAPANWRPFHYPGWNAAEIVVADVDALVEVLDDSLFKILGPPAELSISDDIRAMQVVGPGGELLYLTQIKAPIPGFDLPILEQGVGHCFVAILGVGDLSATQHWYQRKFDLPSAPAVPARVQALSLAFDLEREHRHNICAPALAPGFLIEMDQMPAAAPTRPGSGQFPGGIAMVSFNVERLPAILESSAVQVNGRRTALVRGPNHEWIELLETPYA